MNSFPNNGAGVNNGSIPDDVAIKVENLGKRYRLIDPASKADKLDNLWDYIALPWRRFKEIRSLTHFKEDDDENIFWALRDITFELKQGEVLGIIGRNGAGKSTLLKILSRITAPSEGRAVINGRVNSLLEVGTGFKGTLTGRENVYMNGTIHGMSKKEIDDKLPEIAEFAGLEEGFLDIPVKRYSSGMKVRLGFAVAAHLEPDILIVDEVLAVGDAAFKRKCMRKMNDVMLQGRSVILVSHAMENIEQLCDRCLWLDGGKMMKDGDATEVVTEYLDSFRNEINIPLAEREDRRGNQSYKFINYHVLDRHGNEKKIVRTGDDLILNFEFKKQCNENKLVTIGFIVEDSNSKQLFACSSMLKGENISLSGDGYAEFKIDNFPLRDGLYYINLFIADRYYGGKELIDSIKSAVELEVHRGDFFNVNHINKYNAAFMVDYEMKVVSNSDELVI